MTIMDVARTDVVSAGPDTSVKELAEQMGRENVGSVIIEKNGKIEGIVTDRDLALRCLQNSESAEGMTAKDVMSKEVETIDANTGVFEAIETMSQKGVRRMPITDGRRIAGIVTMDDLTILLASEVSDLSKIAEKEAPAY
ncbi:MAG: CBS domain-containing protein [Halobacteria archaeon]|nr:CBS domain-containing protein [Halobacteria archaeon]